MQGVRSLLVDEDPVIILTGIGKDLKGTATRRPPLKMGLA